MSIASQIASQITRLQAIKTNIRNALIEQGIEGAETHNMADFANDILSIEGGGTPTKIIYASVLPSMEDENTICIITDTEPTYYCWSVDMPSTPTEGMVWISNDSNAHTKISLLTDSTVYLYVAGSSQYVGGVWIPRKTYVMLNGEWILSRLDIVINGNFINSNLTFKTPDSKTTVTKVNDYVRSYNSSGYNRIALTGMVNTTHYNNLVLDLSYTIGNSYSTAANNVCRIATNGSVITPPANTNTNMGGSNSNIIASTKNLGWTNYKLPVSSMVKNANGESTFCIGINFYIDTGPNTLLIRNMYLQ